MKKALMTLSFLLITLLLFSQKHTISGFVYDRSSGEPLLGANIYDVKTYEGTTTNNYGFFSLTLQDGVKKIRISFVGFESDTLNFELVKDTMVTVELGSSVNLEEVEIKADALKQRLRSSQMSVNELPMKDIKKIPVFFGETDIIKTIQLLPGVQSGNDGSSGLFVRGGGSDENLILLDGVPVYNVNHLFGFFSVFNANAINSVKLVKGGFPARYGGRLSSVLDIRMKEGNTKEYHGTVSVGLISANATVEGPVINEKSSFIISARRTYIDLLSMPVQAIMNKTNSNGKDLFGYNFFDLNGKINYRFSEKDKLYLSAYMGNDKAYGKSTYEDAGLTDNDKFKLRWGNITSALRWNHLFNEKLFLNTRASYSRYNFMVGEEYKYQSDQYSENVKYHYGSGIDDVAVSTDFDYIPVPSHYIRFGASYIFHTFTPGVNVYSYKENSSGNLDLVDTTYGNKNVYASEIDTYIEDDFSIGNRIRINAGIHVSGFAVNSKFYYSFQPRMSVRVLASESLSLKASYASMQQYIHLLTSSNIGLPTDLWMPVTDTIKPMRSKQIALGAVYDVREKVEITVEGYYKWLDDLIEYKPGASYLMSNQSWQDLVTVGKGWSYGAEILIKKDLGKITGWIGYTLSWSWRKFDDVSPNKYPYRYDRRNDLSIVITYKLNDKIDMGATWVYGTGYPVTLPYDKYLAMDNYKNYLQNGSNSSLPYIDNVEQRNNYRMAAYHRLDLGINLHKKKKHGERTWSFGIYNAYFRQNPFFLYIDNEYSEVNGIAVSKKVLKQVSLFPGIPYFSYSFKW
jgi:outer membrane receptor for ferrienterochelin and colicin